MSTVQKPEHVAPDEALKESDDVLMKKITWKIIPFLLLLFVVAFIDRVNVAFASLQMNADLGFSTVVYGMGASMFFVGYFLFEVPSNYILSKVGARWWIARIMITWGIFSTGMMFVSNKPTFYVLRLLLGLAEAGFFPGVLFYLSGWFTARYRGRVTSLFLIGIPVSGTIGSPISGLILDRMNNVAGLRGWQWLFLLEGLPAVILGIVCLWWLRNGPADVSWLTAEEKNRVEYLLATERRTVEAVAHYPLSAAFTNLGVLLLACLGFCIFFSATGIMFFLPLIIKAFGVSNTLVGFLSAVPFLGGVVTMLLWARSSDSKHERIWHMAIPLLFGAIGFIAVGFYLPVHWAAMIGLTVAAMGAYSANVVFWTLPMEFMVGTTMAVAIGVVNSLGNLAGIAAPTIIGWGRQVTGSFAVPAWIFAGFLLLGIIVTFLFTHTSMFLLKQGQREAERK